MLSYCLCLQLSSEIKIKIKIIHLFGSGWHLSGREWKRYVLPEVRRSILQEYFKACRAHYSCSGWGNCAVMGWTGQDELPCDTWELCLLFWGIIQHALFSECEYLVNGSLFFRLIQGETNGRTSSLSSVKAEQGGKKEYKFVWEFVIGSGGLE